MVKVHPNNKYYCLQRLPIFLIISIIFIVYLIQSVFDILVNKVMIIGIAKK